jgi:acetoin:2,6-dichlorophenolindophenol oxidoreductase subunit alpha
MGSAAAGAATGGDRLRNDDIGLDRRLELFRLQVEIRDCEKRAFDLFLQNMIKGTSHLSLGQEAIAAGFGVAMREGDKSFCTYRGHAHTLARGAPMEGMLGELMLRDIGLMRGKGGSMHLTSVEHGVFGSYAIVGAHLPIACGSAWRAQYLGEKDVAVCFFGDGTTNIGAFHEALNFAAVWKLPVIFVCENNLYMEYTPIGDVTAVKHPAGDRAAAYGLERIIVDGNDADVVYRTAFAALEKAREGGGPSLIECLTYRPRATRAPIPPNTGRQASLRNGSSAIQSTSTASAFRNSASNKQRSTRSGRRASAKSKRRPRRARRRRRRPSSCSPRTSTRMEAGRGGTDLSRRRRPRHRAGDGA